MNCAFPQFFRLKQIFEASSLGDIRAATIAALAGLPAQKLIRPRMTVAVGAGSRGIANYDLIVRTVCDELKRLGASVFIVPAMGSHGGATAEGQQKILEDFGLSDVVSSMETVQLGPDAFIDREAFQSDGIILVVANTALQLVATGMSAGFGVALLSIAPA